MAEPIPVRSRLSLLADRINLGGSATVTHIAWRGDGKDLYFLSQDNRMMAANIRATATGVEVETPRELFAAPTNFNTLFPCDVTADGQRFLVEEFSGAANEAPLTVLVHWQAGLK